MFERLDEDKSNSLDMREIQTLFVENGIEMTIEECAEMFSVVYEIKNEYLKSDADKKLGSPIKRKKDKTGLDLQLNLEDFHLVASKSRQALLKLQNDLTEIRNRMRAENNNNFVPVTVDELMYQFCKHERRKEITAIRDAHNEELFKALNEKTDTEVRTHVEEVLEAWNAILSERNELSRFKNEQNKTYLKLLEKASNSPNSRNTLLMGTSTD